MTLGLRLLLSKLQHERDSRQQTEYQIQPVAQVEQYSGIGDAWTGAISDEPADRNHKPDEGIESAGGDQRPPTTTRC